MRTGYFQKALTLPNNRNNSNTDMVQYTKNQLEELPTKKLIEMILSLQEEMKSLEPYKRKVKKIERILFPVHSDTVIKEDADRVFIIKPEKRGRKPFNPEEKAEAYERQKAKQREQYAAKKAQKAEE